MPIVGGFPMAFLVSTAVDAPGGRGPDYEFSRVADDGHSGVILEVTPEGGPRWHGRVAFGSPSTSRAVTGVYSTPSPRELCVVARGDAYFIDALSPSRWWLLDDYPVIAVRDAVVEGILVLATPWLAVGVNRGGVTWRKGRLAIDGLRLSERVERGALRGVADPDGAEQRPFVIDLATGRHTGGFPFPVEHGA